MIRKKKAYYVKEGVSIKEEGKGSKGRKRRKKTS